MKKNLLPIFSLCIIILFPTCQPEEMQNAFQVSGYVKYNGLPLSDVAITIDGRTNWMANTDQEGFFKITGVSVGDHEMRIQKTFPSVSNGRVETDSSAFVDKTVSIAVFDDVYFESLKLPKAVSLFPASDISAFRMTLGWSSTDAEDFREYKLFRHSSSGLDETTGTLVHVATNINDTTFVDEDLAPQEEYFYRVYVMNEFGKLGGSNIIKQETVSVDMLQNESFEEINEAGNPLHWTMGHFWDVKMEIDTTVAFEGRASMKYTHGNDKGCRDMAFWQNINRNLWTPGARYKVSFYYKAPFPDPAGEFTRFCLGSGCEIIDDALFPEFNNSQDWQLFEHEFVLPEALPSDDIQMMIDLCLPVNNSWWVDNVTLEKI